MNPEQAADAIAEVFGSSVFTGDFLTGPGIVIPLMLAGIGMATLASNLLRLPRWARVREGQMEHLAGRVGALLEEPPQAEESET